MLTRFGRRFGRQFAARPTPPRPSAVCDRGHALFRFTVVRCPAEHNHRHYRCPMRVGSRRCDEVVVLPPFSDSCKGEEEDRG